MTGNISVVDTYANALMDYILYRAFSKDAEFAANAARATAHYGAFSSAMTTELNGTSGIVPKA